MKVIFIMADTFRRDHIGAYGNNWIHTPNLDRLASISNVFDSHYIGSFPTLPNRRDLHLGTGGPDQPLNMWRPFEASETTLAERLFDGGVHTMMVNDVANSCLQTRNIANHVGQMNMNKGFEFFLGNRGQEGDNYFSDDETPLDYPVDPSLIRYPAQGWHRVLMNRARRVSEDDWFAPGTYKLACEWLERNWRRKDFFLWIETFDPHEPWDPPQWYVDRYDPGYEGRVLDSPTYGFYEEFGVTQREVKHIQALYAGECTMVDHALGRLLGTLDRLNMLEDTAIVFTSDHGTYLGHPGDNGLLGKPHYVGADGMIYSEGQPAVLPIRPFPQYTAVCRIPLIVKMPRQNKSRRFSQITQPWDVTPTILEMFGQKSPPEFLGQSLLPIIGGRKKFTRKAAIMGAARMHIQAMTPEHIYTVWNRPPKSGAIDEWNKVGEELTPPSLIDLKNDPLQKKNIARKQPQVCQALYREIEDFVRRQPNVPEDWMDGLIND